MTSYQVRPVARIESPLTDRASAPKQVDEGAPPSRVVFLPEFTPAAADVRPGDRLVLLTWLHEADRDVQAVHPRGDRDRPSTGVFSTRSPDCGSWNACPARPFALIRGSNSARR